MDDQDNGSIEPNAEAAGEELNAEALTPTDPGATEANEGEAGEPEQPKRATAKDRIDELTRQKYEERREKEYWRNLALEAKQAKSEPEPAPKAADRPDPASYDSGEFDTKFIEDLTDWKANTAVERKLAEMEAKTTAKTLNEQWEQRVAKVAETLPDFESVVYNDRWQMSPTMAEAFRSIEGGPQVAYHLAQNPAEASRIYRLSPTLQAIEIGKLETKLATPKPTKTATDAPTPGPQVRGSGGKFAVAPDTDDFAAFEKQFGG